MHRFLRAIGFSHITSRQDMDKLLGIVLSHPDSKKQAQTSKNLIYTEFKKEFAHNSGIVIRGKYDEKNFFHIEHYFPYCESSMMSVNSDISINKRVDTDAYTAMCDDNRLGVSLIFYLQNAVDYLMLSCADNTPHKARTSLAGLSLKGKILLGVEQSEEKRQHHSHQTYLRNQLIAKAKLGDQDAIDSLTIDEVDLTSKIERRIKNEDLYSIVETSFSPYGSESDVYSILGTIVNWNCINNPLTGESMYQLVISCNDILMTIGLNQADLFGEPMIGRRFKGEVWMQGLVDFQKVL